MHQSPQCAQSCLGRRATDTRRKNNTETLGDQLKFLSSDAGSISFTFSSRSYKKIRVLLSKVKVTAPDYYEYS